MVGRLNSIKKLQHMYTGVAPLYVKNCCKVGCISGAVTNLLKIQKNRGNSEARFGAWVLTQPASSY